MDDVFVLAVRQMKLKNIAPNGSVLAVVESTIEININSLCNYGKHLLCLVFAGLNENKMKEVKSVEYQCEKCKATYSTKTEAMKCEKKAITQDKGVKVGDIVMVTSGDGTGHKAKVESVYVVDKNWGHYAWEKYWHTVAVTAKLIDTWGRRLLTFDSYEPIKARKN